MSRPRARSRAGLLLADEVGDRRSRSGRERALDDREQPEEQDERKRRVDGERHRPGHDRRADIGPDHHAPPVVPIPDPAGPRRARDRAETPTKRAAETQAAESVFS